MSRVAIVHDNFAQMGGAERVTEVIHRSMPEADLLTTLAAREKLSPALQRTRIQTSWMQLLPKPGKYYRHYFLLYPFAIEGMDLSPYDLVITSCFGYAKGVKKRKGAVHVCYCHNPMRWVWRYEDYVERDRFGRISRLALKPLLSALKQWDIKAAARPDFFIANSRVVAERIRTFYGREAVVIPPPIDTERFQASPVVEDYFLVLSRLVPYKRIDLAVEACTRMGWRLVVIGDGPDRARLKAIAGDSVVFLGRQPDHIVNRYAGSCAALLFTGEEDFGMAPLEINSAGRPVIAFRGGGALETVIDRQTGLFFEKPTTESLCGAIEEFNLQTWNPRRLREHAEKFSATAFAERFAQFLRTHTGFDTGSLVHEGSRGREVRV
jgi:glycosyltransferase involved in cell wall biosynthesis